MTALNIITKQRKGSGDDRTLQDSMSLSIKPLRCFGTWPATTLFAHLIVLTFLEFWLFLTFLHYFGRVMLVERAFSFTIYFLAIRRLRIYISLLGA